MPDPFRPLDARLERDLNALRGLLSSAGWHRDRDKLRADILRDARGLDRFIGANGALSEGVVALSRNLDRHEDAVLLFEVLSTTHRLTLATDRLRRGDLEGACEAAARMAEGVGAGAGSLIGRTDLAESWDRRATDFESYTRHLADALEERGYADAGELKRMLNAAHSLAGRPGGSRDERTIAATAAVASALWCGLAVAGLRKALGIPFPVRGYAKILGGVAARLQGR